MKNISIDVYQNDWMPGFAAFEVGSQERGKPNIAINLGALLACVADKTITSEELPYMIAESMMHEIIHVLEEWAKVEFNEEKVEELIKRYAEKYKEKAD